MKHFYDLTPEQIRQSTNSPWHLSEKLDGSYMRAGFDKDGRFYTLRKSTTIYYDVSEWPDKPWTNGFRAGHILMEMFCRTMWDLDYIRGEFYVDVEIINGSMPNSIVYRNRDNVAIITGSSRIDRVNMFLSDVVNRTHKLFNGSYSQEIINNTFLVTVDIWDTLDGETLHKRRDAQKWRVLGHTSKLRIPQSFYSMRNLVAWLDEPIVFRDVPHRFSDLLEFNLNRKPPLIDEADWKANRKEIQEAMRAARTEAREQLVHLCGVVREETIASFAVSQLQAYPTIEGVVVEIDHSGEKFKLVDVEDFGKLNNFTHIIRYWLQGGRRPERPSFLTRTQHWPKEQRLARLEYLRQRYLKYKHKLLFRGSAFYVVDQLNNRTLCAFAEIKERIQDGRDGI